MDVNGHKSEDTRVGGPIDNRVGRVNLGQGYHEDFSRGAGGRVFDRGSSSFSSSGYGVSGSSSSYYSLDGGGTGYGSSWDAYDPGRDLFGALAADTWDNQTVTTNGPLNALLGGPLSYVGLDDLTPSSFKRFTAEDISGPLMLPGSNAYEGFDLDHYLLAANATLVDDLLDRGSGWAEEMRGGVAAMWNDPAGTWNALIDQNAQGLAAKIVIANQQGRGWSDAQWEVLSPSAVLRDQSGAGTFMEGYDRRDYFGDVANPYERMLAGGGQFALNVASGAQITLSTLRNVTLPASTPPWIKYPLAGEVADPAGLNIGAMRNYDLPLTSWTPSAYSVAFEMRLAATEFGISRSEHFQLANIALRAELAANPALVQLVAEPSGWGRPPAGWTWQHATVEQGGGQAGVLQLVPRSQHTSGSAYWPLFHPLPNGGGGYVQWAVPAGARPR